MQQQQQPQAQPYISYRGRWARETLRNYHNRIGDIPHRRAPAPRPGNRPLSIGILGGGAAGLYTAIMLDSLGDPTINYQILEANPDRNGGRLWTYKFSDLPNDYYDVGAMRFPHIPFMDRTFKLFDFLGITPRLINYVMSIPNNLNLFNGIVLTNQQVADDGADPFGTGVLPEAYDKLIDAKIGDFKKKLAENFQEEWPLLVSQYDQYSTRGYMGTVAPMYPQPTIDACETFDSATNLYDEALLETIMDSMDFDWPSGTESWSCIQGGCSEIVNSMQARVKVISNTTVTAIRPNVGNENEWTSINVDTTNTNILTATYDHVVSTLPFSCLRNVDTSKCDFDWELSSAIRSLHYDNSVKVAIKFKYRWWEREKGQIGGVSSTDRPTRVIVYPSYGINGEAASMIVSYTWAQDAARFGALCDERGTPSEKLLLSTILRDLSDIHGYTDYNYLPSLMVDYHAWNWYGDQYSAGAFALFGPGQFQNLYPHVTQPFGGLLHFAGEATSVHHAWVVGSLNSAYRCVMEILEHEQRPDLIAILEQKWGGDDELEKDLVKKQVRLGQHKPILRARNRLPAPSPNVYR